MSKKNLFEALPTLQSIKNLPDYKKLITGVVNAALIDQAIDANDPFALISELQNACDLKNKKIDILRNILLLAVEDQLAAYQVALQKMVANSPSFKKFMNSPSTVFKKILSEQTLLTHRGTHTELMPFLSELGTAHHHEYDRLNSKRRARIENDIVTDIKRSFPVNKLPTLYYLGFSDQNLLQDFFILGKLLFAGYSIDASLIGASLQTPYGISPAVKQLQDYLLILAHERKVNITLASFVDITHYLQTRGTQSLHLITAIAFDPLQMGYNQIVQAHQQLTPGGFFYLSCHAFDLRFNNQYLLSQYETRLSERESLKPLILKNMAQTLHDAPSASLRLALLHTTPSYFHFFSVLPLLTQTSAKDIHVTILMPENTLTSQDALAYFLNRLLKPSQHLTLTCVSDLSAFTASLQETPYTLISVSASTTADSAPLFNTLRLIMQHPGKQYYDIRVGNDDESFFQGVWHFDQTQGATLLRTSKISTFNELMSSPEIPLCDSGAGVAPMPPPTSISNYLLKRESRTDHASATELSLTEWIQIYHP